jgi:hypothetical protein
MSLAPLAPLIRSRRSLTLRASSTSPLPPLAPFSILAPPASGAGGSPTRHWSHVTRHFRDPRHVLRNFDSVGKNRSRDGNREQQAGDGIFHLDDGLPAHQQIAIRFPERAKPPLPESNVNVLVPWHPVGKRGLQWREPELKLEPTWASDSKARLIRTSSLLGVF